MEYSEIYYEGFEAGESNEDDSPPDCPYNEPSIEAHEWYAGLNAWYDSADWLGDDWETSW